MAKVEENMVPPSSKLARPPLNDQDDMLRVVLAQIDKDKQKPQPTPRKGDIVGWCRNVTKRADGQLMWAPAIVVDCLDPGRLQLQVFAGDGQNLIASSALYIHHPECLKDANVKIGTGGGWFYRDVIDNEDFQPDASQLAWHKKKLTDREQLAIKDWKSRMVAEQERLERAKRAKMQPQESPAA